MDYFEMSQNDKGIINTHCSDLDNDYKKKNGLHSRVNL
jgi:hypothetical protein